MTPIEFAMAVLPDGPWCLTAIKPKQDKDAEGGIITRVFTPLQVEAFNAFVKEYNGAWNLYIQPNPPKPGIAYGKGARMTREQIGLAHYAHVDVDLGQHQDRQTQLDAILGMFADGDLEPSVVVFTGNGYQGWFKLPEPTTDFDSVEVRNRGLVQRFGGDQAAHDVSRLLRLPGTWNVPDWKKVLRGCTKVQAEFVWQKPTTFALDDLPKGEEAAAKSAPAVKLDPAKITKVDLDKLEIEDRVKVIIVQGQHPDEDEIDKKRAKLGKDPSRSEWLYDVVCNLVRAGVPDETIYSIITDPDFGISESVLDKGRAAQKYALKQIESAKDEVGSEVICVSGTDIDKTREKVLAAINAHLPVYRQGNRLIRIVHLDGTVGVSTLDAVWLSQLLAPVVTFTKQTAKGAFEIAPPHSLLTDVLKVATLYPGHSLTGVTTTPTLTRNEPGYDEETGLFLAFNEDDFPDMPVKPSREDAEAALGRLAANIRSFAFKDSTALSVALASQLVAVVRGQMSACPLFAFDASIRGSGKTKLAEIAYAIAAGSQEPIALQWTGDATEAEKRVGAQYITGHPAFIIDNVEVPIGSSLLCSALTSSSTDIRVLGVSQLVHANTRVLVLATGNQLAFAGDLSSRVLQCRLEPKGDPTERSFDWDPVVAVRANRPRYVMDALTVLRWYVNTAGSPLAGDMSAKPIRSGTFDDFNMVRGALVSLGHNDPADSRVEVEDTEQDENNLLAVALMAQFGNEPFVTAEVGLLQPVNDKWCPRLMLLADDKWNSAKAGRKIKRLRDRDWYGCKLVVEKDEVRNVRQWRWKGEVPEWVSDNRVFRSGEAEAQFRKEQGG